MPTSALGNFNFFFHSLSFRYWRWDEYSAFIQLPSSSSYSGSDFAVLLSAATIGHAAQDKIMVDGQCRIIMFLTRQLFFFLPFTCSSLLVWMEWWIQRNNNMTENKHFSIWLCRKFSIVCFMSDGIFEHQIIAGFAGGRTPQHLFLMDECVFSPCIYVLYITNWWWTLTNQIGLKTVVSYNYNRTQSRKMFAKRKIGIVSHHMFSLSFEIRLMLSRFQDLVITWNFSNNIFMISQI